jgi:hypothetical protein
MSIAAQDIFLSSLGAYGIPISASLANSIVEWSSSYINTNAGINILDGVTDQTTVDLVNFYSNPDNALAYALAISSAPWFVEWSQALAQAVSDGSFDPDGSESVWDSASYQEFLNGLAEIDTDTDTDTGTVDRHVATFAEEFFNGGIGLDIVTYVGNFLNYSISVDDNVVSVTNKTSSADIDTLNNIERLEFGDAYIALDIEGANSAGGIYRTYEAAFDRTPDLGGFGYWIDRADSGATAVQMAEEFVWSNEFQTVYGVTTSDNYLTGNDIETVVDGFYRNVLGRDPDQGGLDFYSNVIELHERTVGRVLAEIADSAENRDNLLPAIENGMEYDLWLV